jgi:hypothetical protein
MTSVAISDIDMGDLPTWLGVVFATVAGADALLLLKREAGRDRTYKEERRRNRPEMVSAWIDTATRTYSLINCAPCSSTAPISRSTRLSSGWCLSKVRGPTLGRRVRTSWIT